MTLVDGRGYPLIIAHRGASALAPENTLAAFGKAIEDDAEGIEFDVRLSSDGVPIVFHDSNLRRICGVDQKVSRMSSDELLSMDAGSWFDKKSKLQAETKFAGEPIPTLQTTLDFLSSYKGFIYIELKSKESESTALAEAVCNIIRQADAPERFIIKSFKLDAIPHIRKSCPAIATAALFKPKVKTIMQKEKRLINISTELGANRLSLHFSLATRKLIRKASRNSLPVTIWTVDNPRWVKRSIELGIDHVITNNPARLLARRNELCERSAILS